MKIARVEAHPNIALVKYWGKRNVALNLPSAPSLSATLSGVKTTTRVEFKEGLKKHELYLNGEQAPSKDQERVHLFVEQMMNAFNMDGNLFAEIYSENDFPTAAGLASSASGFAALAFALSEALELDLSKAKLSEWARRGSGSAARSIFGGWVEMRASDNSESAIARPIAPVEHWDLRCMICVTVKGRKSIGSTEAMESTKYSSPYFEAWIEDTIQDVHAGRDAVEKKDFFALAKIAERSCLRMHACAMSADPGIIYWNASTLNLIALCRQMQREGMSVFFTIDAGPHVKLFYESAYEEKILTYLAQSKDLVSTIKTRIGGGVKRVDP